MGNLKSIKLLIKYMKYIVNNKIEELFNNILIGCAKLMTLNYEFIYLIISLFITIANNYYYLI